MCLCFNPEEDEDQDQWDFGLFVLETLELLLSREENVFSLMSHKAFYNIGTLTSLGAFMV